MKNEKLDNPPIFPLDEYRYAGITLLYYFAAKAMQGFTSNEPTHGEFIEDMVVKSYKIAQTMLKERQKHL